MIEENLKAVRQFEAKMQQEADNIPQSHKDKVRKLMMKESPKVKPPKKLYHGTAVENEKAILEQGILAHKVFGQIYFCESPEDVLKFIKPPCILFEVDTRKMLPKRFRLSLDHDKKVYKCVAYAYYGDVPKEAITEVLRK